MDECLWQVLFQGWQPVVFVVPSHFGSNGDKLFCSPMVLTVVREVQRDYVMVEDGGKGYNGLSYVIPLKRQDFCERDSVATFCCVGSI